MVFDWLFKPKKSEAYQQAQILFEKGLICASNFKCDEAIELYTQSIALFENPSPYINRANLLSKRIRHFEAFQDLLTAQVLDKAQGNQFAEVLKREIVMTATLAQNCLNGAKEKLVTDLHESGHEHVAAMILTRSFGVSDAQWKWNSFDRTLLEYHLFNELDNVVKFENAELYPDAKELLRFYSDDFIQFKVSNLAAREGYDPCELKLHSFLCVYDEEDMRRLRNWIIYAIHDKLLAKDFGGLYQSLSSECEGVIKEAETYTKP